MILQDWVHCLEQLHAKFGDLPVIVGEMAPEVRKAWYEFRVAFLQEELDELRAAKTAEDAVDAVIDLCVVAVGTLHAFGVDAREAWRRVQEANMAKVPGQNPSRPNAFGLPDLVKPDGWLAPDHSGNTGLLSRVVPC
jgi:predicted HAD superfamily Cof-like phosphohydrolase